jgi:hypothetical protein
MEPLEKIGFETLETTLCFLVFPASDAYLGMEPLEKI